MAVNNFILIAILLGFVVSWVPVFSPFVLVKYKGLQISLFDLHCTQFLSSLPDSL